MTITPGFPPSRVTGLPCWYMAVSGIAMIKAAFPPAFSYPQFIFCAYSLNRKSGESQRRVP